MKLNYLILSICAFLIFSCNNEEKNRSSSTEENNSVTKDTLRNLNTNSIVINNGLKCSSYEIFGDNKKLSENAIERGKSLVIRINDIEGLIKDKEGKSNIGCAIKIFDEQGRLVFAEPNLFKYVKPFNVDSVNDFQSAVLIPQGTKALGILVSGVFYDIKDTTSKIKFQSKLKLINPDNPKGIFTTFIGTNITIEKSILQTASNGIVKTNEVTLGDTLYFFAIEPKGFTIEGGKLSLDCETSIFDENKKLIIHNPNLFANVGSMDAINTKLLNAAMIINSPMKKGKKYSWRVRFYDKKANDKEIIYLYSFIVR
jgi:hypothetical protein